MPLQLSQKSIVGLSPPPLAAGYNLSATMCCVWAVELGWKYIFRFSQKGKFSKVWKILAKYFYNFLFFKVFFLIDS
jgi:hypothetical protein